MYCTHSQGHLVCENCIPSLPKPLICPKCCTPMGSGVSLVAREVLKIILFPCIQKEGNATCHLCEHTSRALKAPLSPQLFPISHLFRGEERVRNGQDGNERDRIGRDGKESSVGELLSVELSLFHAILRGSTNRRSDVGGRVRLYQTILGGAGGAK